MIVSLDLTITSAIFWNEAREILSLLTFWMRRLIWVLPVILVQRSFSKRGDLEGSIARLIKMVVKEEEGEDGCLVEDSCKVTSV